LRTNNKPNLHLQVFRPFAYALVFLGFWILLFVQAGITIFEAAKAIRGVFR